MQPSPAYTIPAGRTAVVLNRNAGQVSERLAAQLAEIVPEQRVYLTDSALHSRDIVRRCVEDEVTTLFAGGGDGTIVGVLNDLAECSRQRTGW